MAAYVIVPITFAGLFCVKGKARSILLSICIVFFTASLTTHLSQYINWKIRKSSFERVSHRAEVIIQAIESYRKHRNETPKSLDLLAPEYISKIPGTGIRAYPIFEYKTPESANEYYKDILEKHNVPYELRVNCPLGFLNWDCFIYWPSESYPDNIDGAFTELIGRWAYLHE
jgi:hypothetical protein